MVKIEEHLSEPGDITYGVPQGLILGPSFFIMYLNDVITSFGENTPNIILYADDTAQCYAHNQLKEKNTCDWCIHNKLFINL